MDLALKWPWCSDSSPSTSRCLRSLDRPTKNSTNPPIDRAESGFVASFQPDAESLSPTREAYAHVAPRLEDWPTLLAKARQAADSGHACAVDIAAMLAP